MPLLTLFALKALLDLWALNSNNVRGGTCLAEAGGAKKSIQNLASSKKKGPRVGGLCVVEGKRA